MYMYKFGFQEQSIKCTACIKVSEMLAIVLLIWHKQTHFQNANCACNWKAASCKNSFMIDFF